MVHLSEKNNHTTPC